jgi:hypothetical protein
MEGAENVAIACREYASRDQPGPKPCRPGIPGSSIRIERCRGYVYVSAFFGHIDMESAHCKSPVLHCSSRLQDHRAALISCMSSRCCGVTVLAFLYDCFRHGRDVSERGPWESPSGPQGRSRGGSRRTEPRARREFSSRRAPRAHPNARVVVNFMQATVCSAARLKWPKSSP